MNWTAGVGKRNNSDLGVLSGQVSKLRDELMFYFLTKQSKCGLQIKGNGQTETNT